jgi:hypothetical protein
VRGGDEREGGPDLGDGVEDGEVDVVGAARGCTSSSLSLAAHGQR